MMPCAAQDNGPSTTPLSTSNLRYSGLGTYNSLSDHLDTLAQYHAKRGILRSPPLWVVGRPGGGKIQSFHPRLLDVPDIQPLCRILLLRRCRQVKRVVEVLKAGLERTLAQVRQLNGRIEKDTWGGYSFTKRKGSTVRFVVQWLDAPEDADKLWAVLPMTYGERPEATPERSPVTAGFKASFVRGGLVFSIHHHHYSQDVMAWAGFIHEPVENCSAFSNGTAYPSWDPACNDVSRFLKPEPPEEEKVDGSPPPDRHPDHKVGICLLFHLPKSKAAQPKELAKPDDGTWISTHVSTSTQPKGTRSHSTKRYVRGHVYDRTCGTTNDTGAHLGLAVLVSSAVYGGDYPHEIQASTPASIRIRPMSTIVLDHRDANVPSADFGFGKPATYRYLMGRISEGGVLVYPPRDPSPESDEGPEIAIMYEKELAQTLIEDPEWNKFFEYRGVDAEHTEA
ncbi:hypothetical protein CSAL01_12292 [Colletotrichum salicis]|uniref:Uncharacterized protein n=1 Tax=Colletotrichum salicis TaxID=1209931 RepID=A0A135V024_9PEZI|nr:hypothetical protein CSAL01_12292 [Colletotrichum salicis]